MYTPAPFSRFWIHPCMFLHVIHSVWHACFLHVSPCDSQCVVCMLPACFPVWFTVCGMHADWDVPVLRWRRSCTHNTWRWLERGNWRCQISHSRSSLHWCWWSADNSRQGIPVLPATYVQISSICFTVAFFSLNLEAETKAVRLGFEICVLKK